MAKRARIVMLISMLCLCVSLLVVGVFAVSTITFNVSSSLNYEYDESAPMPTFFTYGNSNNITGLSEEYLSLETKPETLVIPNKDANGNNITSILDGPSSASPTFEGLASSNVIIQEGITRIGDFAFRNCSSITSIELPNSLTSIGFWAFDGCSLLENIEIPSSVTSMESSPFANCSLLQITVASENRYYISHEGSLYNKAQTELIRCAGRVSTITILDTVTSIGDYAFSSCNLLTNIEIPSSVRSIGDGVFEGCSSLESIEIPNGVTSIGYRAFFGCSSLASIELPNSLTSIGLLAFASCSSLASIEIPSSVTSIESDAFSSCSSLQTTVASDNANYSSHEGSLYNKAQTELIRGAGGVSTVTILDTVTSIGSNAFSGCSLLTNIEIPNSVTSIGSYAFEFCSSLESVTFEANSQLTSIDGNSFYNCSSLTNIEIPSSVTSIDSNVFYDCTNLTSLTINTKPGYVWQKASNSTFTSDLSIVDLSNASQNATWFKNTYGYHNCYWRQIEESAA